MKLSWVEAELGNTKDKYNMKEIGKFKIINFPLRKFTKKNMLLQKAKEKDIPTIRSTKRSQQFHVVKNLWDRKRLYYRWYIIKIVWFVWRLIFYFYIVSLLLLLLLCFLFSPITVFLLPYYHNCCFMDNLDFWIELLSNMITQRHGNNWK